VAAPWADRVDCRAYSSTSRPAAPLAMVARAGSGPSGPSDPSPHNQGGGGGRILHMRKSNYVMHNYARLCTLLHTKENPARGPCIVRVSTPGIHPPRCFPSDLKQPSGIPDICMLCLACRGCLAPIRSSSRGLIRISIVLIVFLFFLVRTRHNLG